MRVFLFDPCLGTMTGHWENFCRRFYDAFHARGIECRIFSQAETLPGIVNGLSVIPTFTRSPFIDANDTNSFTEECAFFARDFSRIDLSLFQDGDHFIFPTIFPQVLKPLMEWLARVNTKADVTHSIIFQFQAGFEKGNGLRAIKGAVRRLLAGSEKAKKMPRGISWAYTPMVGNYLSIAPMLSATRGNPRYRYFASSKELAHNFSKLLGISADPLPMPAPALDDTAADRPSGKPSALTVGYFGHAALEKGAQHLEPVIDKVLRATSNTEFHLHINPNKDTVKILAPFEKERPHVRCVHGHVSQDELLRMMKGVDIVLMPYYPAKYRSIPSAVFTECMSMGKVMVIPADTWIHDEAKAVQAGYIAFRDYTAEAIATALLAAIQRFPELKAQSQEAGARFRARHGIGRCVDMLLHQAA